MSYESGADEIGTAGAGGVRTMTKAARLLELSAAAINCGALFGRRLWGTLRLRVEVEGNKQKCRAKNEEDRQVSHKFR